MCLTSLLGEFHDRFRGLAHLILSRTKKMRLVLAYRFYFDNFSAQKCGTMVSEKLGVTAKLLQVSFRIVVDFFIIIKRVQR